MTYLSAGRRTQYGTVANLSKRGASIAVLEVMAQFCCVIALMLMLAPSFAFADPSEEPAPAPLHPKYIEAKAAIDQKRYAEALPLLRQVLAQHNNDANAHNLLGFAYRKTGNLDAAFKHYNTALRLNPGHRGAHEYIGEAFLMVNNLAQAEAHLRALNRLCLLPCEEYTDLQKAVESYKAERKRGQRQ